MHPHPTITPSGHNSTSAKTEATADAIAIPGLGGVVTGHTMMAARPYVEGWTAIICALNGHRV